MHLVKGEPVVLGVAQRCMEVTGNGSYRDTDTDTEGVREIEIERQRETDK